MDIWWESGFVGLNKNIVFYGYNVINYIFFFGLGCFNLIDFLG